MTTIVIIVAIILGLTLLSFYKPIMVPLLLIPVSYMVYFLFVTTLNDRLGYPVDSNLVTEKYAYLLYGVQSKDKLFLLVKEDDKEEPRLLVYPRTKSLDEKFDMLQKPETSKRIKIGKGLTPELLKDKIGKNGEGQDKDGKNAGSDGENDNTDGLSLIPDEDFFIKE